MNVRSKPCPCPIHRITVEVDDVPQWWFVFVNGLKFGKSANLSIRLAWQTGGGTARTGDTVMAVHQSTLGGRRRERKREFHNFPPRVKITCQYIIVNVLKDMGRRMGE